MDTILFGGVTAGQLLTVCVVFLVLVIGGKIVKRLFFKPKPYLQNTRFVVCNYCDWQGNISKYGNLCPKCNQPIDSEERPPAA